MAIPQEQRLQTVETNSGKRILRPMLAGKAGFATRVWSFLSKMGISEISKPHERSIESDVPRPNHKDRRICAF
jgi:hypothetical protein